ncbi:MAG: hypothetical protein HFE57_05340 [Firmicutes bacterium]|jgi:hypothetical protein|nr:hypothetical protein [Bacillota bacterium]
MASKQQLKEANYVHYDDYKEGRNHCGFGCDYSKVIRDDITDEKYRYCTKLQMYVGDYDLCKYYNDEEMMGLITQMANFIQEEDEVVLDLIQKENEMESNPIQKVEVKKKNHWITILIIICICVFIYIRMK